jgi:hypothetical protein
VKEILEKIDKEIKNIRRIGRELDTPESLENARLITQGMEYAKQIILSEQSEQKEPCECYKCPSDYCVVSLGQECPLSDGKHAPFTIGDKIRESNESLVEFIEQNMDEEREDWKPVGC